MSENRVNGTHLAEPPAPALKVFKGRIVIERLFDAVALKISCGDMVSAERIEAMMRTELGADRLIAFKAENT